MCEKIEFSNEHILDPELFSELWNKKIRSMDIMWTEQQEILFTLLDLSVRMWVILNLRQILELTCVSSIVVVQPGTSKCMILLSHRRYLNINHNLTSKRPCILLTSSLYFDNRLGLPTEIKVELVWSAAHSGHWPSSYQIIVWSPTFQYSLHILPNTSYLQILQAEGTILETT